MYSADKSMMYTGQPHQFVPGLVNPALIPNTKMLDYEHRLPANSSYMHMNPGTKPKSFLTSTIAVPKMNSVYMGHDVVPPRSYPTVYDRFVPTNSFCLNKSMENKSLQKMNCFPKQRFTPYISGRQTKLPLNAAMIAQAGLVQAPTVRAGPPSKTSSCNSNDSGFHHSQSNMSDLNISSASSSKESTDLDSQKKVMLQLNNLDSSYDENSLKSFLVSLLKPITPIISLNIDGNSSAKVEVPSSHFAKSVISQLHRKKIGRKRMLVSYCKETINDISTLGYQVAGLLRDVPYFTLPLNKFRELFQARFKTSISVLELYKMQDVCHIQTDENEEKHIILNQAFLTKIEESPFNPNMQHSIPYCARHFKRESYKEWAEQELEPLPNVFLTISQVQTIVYRLLQSHAEGIPVASILHCIESCLSVAVTPNDAGISLEHLLSCVKGIQIENNVYGIKIIQLTKNSDKTNSVPDIYDGGDALFYQSKSFSLTAAQQLSKEVIQLLKKCPKATMNFSKFVPAYHNHFGKQCRVADYGYTKLIELFEGMASIIQVLGEGNNRHITLTHRIQVRRFANDLLKTIKWQVNKSVLLSQVPHLLAFTLNHTFSITDYGVCTLTDMLDELEAIGVIACSYIGADILISLPKHKQSPSEIENTFIFAVELVELCRNMPQYEIPFQKFIKSYYYHFGYHCRLNDYGFQKLSELFDAVDGLIKMDPSNDENRKIILNPVAARRVFAEQINEVISLYSKRKGIRVPLVDVINLFKNKFGYTILPQTLGCKTIDDMMRCLPFIEINETGNDFYIISHFQDHEFRKKSLMICLLFIQLGVESILYSEFFPLFYQHFNEYLTESYVLAMKNVIEVHLVNGVQVIVLSPLIKFVLSVICRLDTKTSITFKNLKSQMEIQINTCFEYGFANLSSLLSSFPEIFSLIPKPSEQCDIKLQPQVFVSKPDIQKYFRRLQKPIDQTVPGQVNYVPLYPAATQVQSFHQVPSTFSKTHSTEEYPHQLEHQQPDFVCNTCENYDDLEHSRPCCSHSHQILHYPPDNFVTTVQKPTASIQSKWIGGIKKNFLSLNIQSLFYEPPKPDTPPSKVWPFGFDPVWSEAIDSPKINGISIDLPDLIGFPPSTPVQTNKFNFDL